MIRSLRATDTFVLHWFRFLFFCEDSPSVGQVGVCESSVTARLSPITLFAVCRAVPLLRKASYLSNTGIRKPWGFREYRAKLCQYDVYPQEATPPTAGIPHRVEE